MSTSPGRLPAAVFGAAIAIAVIGVVAGVATNMSESNLVALSYALVPLLVFGIVGLASGRNLKLAIIWAVVALLSLFVFMVAIFPSL